MNHAPRSGWFVLDGQPCTGIHGGPAFTFDGAVSLLVNCADQDEIDRYWNGMAKIDIAAVSAAADRAS